MSGSLCVPTFCGGGRGDLVEGRVVRNDGMELEKKVQGGFSSDGNRIGRGGD